MDIMDKVDGGFGLIIFTVIVVTFFLALFWLIKETKEEKQSGERL